MYHFVLILLTFVNGKPIQNRELATFDDFDTCQRVALAMQSADYETGIVTTAYCKRAP